MPKSDDRVERVVSFLRAVPFWAAVVLSGVSFGAGLAIPLTMHLGTVILVVSAVCGALFGAVVLFGWFLVYLKSQLDAADRRHLVDWTSSLRLLDAEEFEWFVGEIFRREGFQVTETGSQEHADGNVDLVLTKDGVRSVVQCKRWQAMRVGVDEIRRFGGTLLREGLAPGAGVFVTLSDFTEPARAEAGQTGIALVDGRQLEERWSKVRRTEPCPVCNQAMLVGKSPYGWWLRCVAPGCAGKRNLAGEPGRAVELLTEPPRL